MSPRWSLDTLSLQDLQSYLELFRPDFRRADQAGWATVYLQGLFQQAQHERCQPRTRGCGPHGPQGDRSRPGPAALH